MKSGARWSKVVLWWLLARALMVLPLAAASREQAVWSDVLVYSDWSERIFAGDDRAMLREYPPLARAFVLLPGAAGGLATYAATFIALMALVDLLILRRIYRLAVAWGNGLGVWLWVAGPALLGSLTWARFDLLPVGALMVALSSQRSTQRIGFGALAIMLKVWPLVAMAGLVGRGRRMPVNAIAIVSASVIGSWACWWVPGGTAFSWLPWARDRGIQVESLPGLLIVLGSMFATPAHVAYEFNSWQVRVPGTLDLWLADGLAALGAAAMLVWTLAFLRRQSEKTALLTSCLCVATLLLTSKVFSPQYILWLLGPCAVALSRADLRRSRMLFAVTLGTAGATHLVYPTTYHELLELHALGASLLLTRFALLACLIGVLANELWIEHKSVDGARGGADTAADRVAGHEPVLA